MPRPNWRTQYDPTRDAQEGNAAAIECKDPSLTQQQFANDADINILVKRFGISDGAIPPAVMDPQYYGDFSDVPDFRGALEATRTAQERFDQLPADIRNRFYNDPVKLWDFVNDQSNAEEAVKLGLLHRKTLPTPEAPPAAPPTPATP